jgi:hypothetical protein
MLRALARRAASPSELLTLLYEAQILRLDLPPPTPILLTGSSQTCVGHFS